MGKGATGPARPSPAALASKSLSVLCTEKGPLPSFLPGNASAATEHTADASSARSTHQAWVGGTGRRADPHTARGALGLGLGGWPWG